jgi:hypothetical protein
MDDAIYEIYTTLKAEQRDTRRPLYVRLSLKAQNMHYMVREHLEKSGLELLPSDLPQGNLVARVTTLAELEKLAQNQDISYMSYAHSKYYTGIKAEKF